MNLSIAKADASDIPKLIEVQNKGFYEDYKQYGHCPFSPYKKGAEISADFSALCHNQMREYNL